MTGALDERTGDHIYRLIYADDDLGLCGCGTPEAAFSLVRDILNLAPFYEDQRWRQVEELVGNDGAHHIVLSMLTRAGLIEHGSSISGSWLTDKGRYYQTALAGIADWDFLDEGNFGYPHDGKDCTDACWRIEVAT